MRKWDIVYLLFFLLMGCNHSSKKTLNEEEVSSINEIEEEGVKVIDLESAFEVGKDTMLLSDIVEDVEYIKLETTEENLISQAVRLRVTDKYLFISTWRFGQIYMFDRKGKFVRRLGQVGQGPGEYKLGRSFTVDDSLVYIQTNSLRHVFKYRINDNSYQGKFATPTPYIGEVYTLGDGNIIGCIGDGAFLKDIFTLHILDNEGNTIFYSRPTNLNIEELQKLSKYTLTGALPCWQTSRGLNVYEFNNDTIYRVTRDGVSPRYVWHLGKYKMPPESFYHYKNRFVEEPKYFTFRSFLESSRYLYGRFDYQGWEEHDWYVRYDKKTGEIKFWQFSPLPDHDAEFYNDVDGARIIYNRFIPGDYVWCPITYDSYQEDILPSYFNTVRAKFPDKHIELKRLLEEMREEDNPIIVLYKLK